MSKGHIYKLNSDENTNRTVFWVHDQVGGCGKSVLAHHIVSHYNGALFFDFDYKNNAYIYQKEAVVVFDLPKTYIPHDFRLVEDLKNGVIISQKYEVVRKVFNPAVVIIFSNNEPNLNGLSLDRWRVLTVRQNLNEIELHQNWVGNE